MNLIDNINRWIVYVLYNKERQKTYIGFTRDIITRVLRHNNVLPHKKTSYTYKQSGTWILIYKEEFMLQKDALKREKWFKSGVGREFIQENLSSWIRAISR